MFIDAMNLKNRLCDSQPDASNLHDAPLSMISFTARKLSKVKVTSATKIIKAISIT